MHPVESKRSSVRQQPEPVPVHYLEGLRRAVDALPVLIAQLDREEHHQYSSRAYAEWFGRTPEALRQRLLAEVLGADSYGRLQPYLRAALSGERQSFETVLRHNSRGDRVVHVQYVPVTDPAGGISGISVWMNDITEAREARDPTARQDLEQRVRDRTAQLQAINKELEAFCYSVSHDLRAPLRSIRGFSEVLLEQYAPQLDERGRDFLRRACEASAFMDRLIEDLLKLSRVSQGELRAGTVDVSAAAAEVAAGLNAAEPGRPAEFIIASGLKAHGDERLLRLALDNLLRNAWKFTGKCARARIEFGCEPGAEPVFFVRDNGAGFNMDYAGKLFGVFQRLHSAAEYPGSGVGLAIVQRIVNRHGGRVWATGRVNEGATFYFTLPVPGNRHHIAEVPGG